MSIYADSGVTLFQGGNARTVSFAATNIFTAATAGNAVYVDGVAVTGASAPMPIASGGLAGNATLRDSATTTYQAQLDNIAGALINTFAESDQVGAGSKLPGLFTTPGAATLPATNAGLASSISVNLLRDGGISGNADYVYNPSGAAGYTGRISQLIGDLSATQSFSSAGGITTNASLGDYASASVSWLEGERSSASSQSSYQGARLSTASTALSNATGVNIDDQMSQMLDLERSYSASAQLLTSINTMFKSLVTALG
jgi:flagellar hook-associated protein 1 FlgK